MFAGRSIVSSVLRRAVVSTSSSRTFVVPVLSVLKNVCQPRILTSIVTRGYMTSGILSMSVDPSDNTPKPRMQPAANPDAIKSSLFIGNLDFAITEQSLLDMCEGILGPDIATRARVAVDRDTGNFMAGRLVVESSVYSSDNIYFRMIDNFPSNCWSKFLCPPLFH